MNNYKTSEAKPNSNIKITNRRLINTCTNNPEFFSNEENSYNDKFDRYINLDFDYIFRMRNEANTFFAISNFNKSIELNTTVIKLIENKKKLFINLLEKNNFEILKNINTKKSNSEYGTEIIEEFDFSKSKTFEIVTNCLNNRGNSYLRNNNFKEAINDFNIVLERDPKNVKAYFRRAVAYFNLQIYNNSLRDLKNALDLTINDQEKKGIQNQIDKTLNEINTLVQSYKKKSENYELSQETVFRRAILTDINEDLVQSIKDLKENGEKYKSENEEAYNFKKGIYSLF